MNTWDITKQIANEMHNSILPNAKEQEQTPLNEAEKFALNDLAYSLAGMAQITGIYWETKDALRFIAEDQKEIVIHAEFEDTKDSPRTLIVYADETVEDEVAEYPRTVARINLTNIRGVYSDMYSTDAFSGRIAEKLGYANETISYTPTKTRIWTWYSSVEGMLQEISDRNFESDGVLEYGLYAYRLPEDYGFVLPEQFKSILPTNMLQNRFIIMSTIGGALDMSIVGKRWNDENFWSNVWTEQVVEEDADERGCYLDQLYEGNVSF